MNKAEQHAQRLQRDLMLYRDIHLFTRICLYKYTAAVDCSDVTIHVHAGRSQSRQCQGQCNMNHQDKFAVCPCLDE